MLKNGALAPLTERQTRSLSSAEPWILKALSEGKPLSTLAFLASEADELSFILDWMRSSDGPSESSDWSRISWPQALVSHQKWIHEMARRAQKTLFMTSAFDGCESACSAGGDLGLEGWQWVRVATAAALAREGSLMANCVGSYASRVASGSCKIWSLRNAAGKPFLTIETLDEFPATRNDGLPKMASALSIAQIRAFGNGDPKPEHGLAICSLAAHFDALGTPVSSCAQDLLSAGLVCTPSGFGGWRTWTGVDGEIVDLEERICLFGPSLHSSSISRISDFLRIIETLPQHCGRHAGFLRARLAAYVSEHEAANVIEDIVGRSPEQNSVAINSFIEMASPSQVASAASRLIERGIDIIAPALAKTAPALGASHCEDIFRQSMLSGSLTGSELALERLCALAAPAHSAADEAAEDLLLSYENLSRVIHLADASVSAFSSNAGLVGELISSPIGVQSTELFCSVPPMRELADFFGDLRASSVFSGVSLLSQLFSTRIESMADLEAGDLRAKLALAIATVGEMGPVERSSVIDALSYEGRLIERRESCAVKDFARSSRFANV